MLKFEPLLVFDGDCNEALAYYKGIFGGEMVRVQTYGDNKEHLAKMGIEVTPKWEDKVMHASMVLSNGYRFFLADRAEKDEFHPGNANAVVLSFNKMEDMDKIYNEMKKDGQVTVEIHKAFWHAMYAEIIDKFKKRWIFNCQIVSIMDDE